MCVDPYDLVGSKVAGRYLVEAVVGHGGFSIVYRARHTLLDHPVAIKAFNSGVGVDDEARDKMFRSFLQEGAMLAELSAQTSAIVQARDMATCVTPSGEWIPFLVLEWLDGETLEAVLWRERSMSPRSAHEAVALLEPIAKALSLAHTKGICHRDLKPGNIFVMGEARTEGATAKLLDFGAATFFGDAEPRSADPRRAPRSRTESYAFTALYGAPEQFDETYGPTGPATDVFALALILVELLAGRQPLGNGPVDELARASIDPTRRPTPHSLGVAVSDAVNRVLERALSVKPSDRWSSAGAFWSALHTAMGERPETTDAPASRALSAPPPPRRRRHVRAPAVGVGRRASPWAVLAFAAMAAASATELRADGRRSAARDAPPDNAVAVGHRGSGFTPLTAISAWATR